MSLLLLGLFHGRNRWGYGPLFAAVGVLQYVQVVLVGTVYVDVPWLGTVSPGSMVLFSSTLFVVLLVYVHSDIARTPQLIAGLAIANAAVVVLSYTATLHLGSDAAVAAAAPPAFFEQNLRLLSVGTACLVLDAVLLVVIYEALSFHVLGSWIRIYLSVAGALAIDQCLFVTGSFWETDDYWARLSSGFAAKGVSAAFFTTALWVYLRYRPEPHALAHGTAVSRVFGILSYRQRYALLDEDFTALAKVEQETQQALQVTQQSLVAEATQRIGTEISLKEREERLAAVSEQLITAQETERRAIAQVLHDELGQLLTALKMELSTQRMAEPESEASHARAASILDLAVEEVRSLTQQLRPRLLDDLGLEPALRSRIELLRDSSGLRFELHCDLALERLPRRFETVLYRVAQEALTNAVRHARASAVTVSLIQTDEEVQLLVTDDGVGFDTRVVRSELVEGRSLGLTGMMERVEMIGGQITIESRPGEGTTVHMTAPCRRDPPMEIVRPRMGVGT